MKQREIDDEICREAHTARVSVGASPIPRFAALSPRQSTTKDEDNRQVVREVNTQTDAIAWYCSKAIGSRHRKFVVFCFLAL